MDHEMYTALESEQKDIHNRLKIELSIGIVILLAGSTMFVMSFLNNSKN